MPKNSEKEGCYSASYRQYCKDEFLKLLYNASSSKHDLHTHTRKSCEEEATIEPEEILKAAQERGLKYLGITDHNSFEGYKAVMNLKPEINIIAGAEIICRNTRGVSFHCVAYIPHKGIDVFEKSKIFEKLLAQEVDESKKCISKLADAGITFNQEDLKRIEAIRHNKRAAIARLILSKEKRRTIFLELAGIDENTSLKDTSTALGKIGYFKFPAANPKKVCKICSTAGGACLIAHPGRRGDLSPRGKTLCEDEKLNQLIELFKMGFMGIQVVPENVRNMRALAKPDREQTAKLENAQEKEWISAAEEAGQKMGFKPLIVLGSDIHKSVKNMA
jgi:hypothetical protein